MAHLTPCLQKEFHSFRRSRIESHQQKVQELNGEITKLNMECQQLRQQARAVEGFGTLEKIAEVGLIWEQTKSERTNDKFF